jgi:hypothetical protein
LKDIRQKVRHGHAGRGKDFGAPLCDLLDTVHLMQGTGAEESESYNCVATSIRLTSRSLIEIQPILIGHFYLGATGRAYVICIIGHDFKGRPWDWSLGVSSASQSKECRDLRLSAIWQA